MIKLIQIKMRTNIAILCFLIITIVPAIGQLKNYKIIDSLIREHIEIIKPEILNEKKRCFNLETNNSEIDFMIENNLLDKFQDFSFHKEKENNCTKLKIHTSQVNVKYKMLDDELVQRNISVEISVIFEPKDEPIRLIHNKNLAYSDTIPRKEVSDLQKSQHNFDKGEIPEEESTFYDNYIQPIIFIGTAIITIAILFTVRSS